MDPQSQDLTAMTFACSGSSANAMHLRNVLTFLVLYLDALEVVIICVFVFFSSDFLFICSRIRLAPDDIMWLP